MSTLATLERPLFPAVEPDDGSTAASAFFAADTVSEDFLPLSLVYGGEETGAGVSRLRIELDRGARAKVILRYEAAPGLLAGQPVFRTALNIRLAAGARLDLFVVSSLPRSLERQAADTAVLGDRAKLVWTEAG